MMEILFIGLSSINIVSPPARELDEDSQNFASRQNV